MHILVIGYGSIGKRHARILAEMGHEVGVLSSQVVSDYQHFTSLSAALSALAPHYIVIASATDRHQADMAALQHAGFRGIALVEKPLFTNAPPQIEAYNFTIYVAYNLRFHPVISALKQHLEGQNILSAVAYVGQHLAQWRPDRAVKETYSAHKIQGGGVVRDLSHELDLAQYLFSALCWQSSMAARVADITHDSEDVASILLNGTRCPHINIHMNYLDHTAARWWRVMTEQHSYHADMIAGTLCIDGTVHPIACNPDTSYRAMHEAALGGNAASLCSYEQGLAIMDIIVKVAP